MELIPVGLGDRAMWFTAAGSEGDVNERWADAEDAGLHDGKDNATV